MPYKNREPNRTLHRRTKSRGLRARRSLGQNFLVVDSIADAIGDAACVTADDTILEVGPGPGALTERLASVAGRVVAVELDEALARKLKKNTTPAGRTSTSAGRGRDRWR